MPGLTNKYLNDLGGLLCGDSFLGVYSSDIQPQFQNKLCKFSIIFNEDKHDKAGSHFVAIVRDGYNLYYFDSFGKKCKNKILKKFIKKNLKGKRYIYNTKCIQEEKSLFCGLFCISFISALNKQIPFEEYINRFSINLNENNIIVTEMITHEIKNKFY